MARNRIGIIRGLLKVLVIIIGSSAMGFAYNATSETGIPIATPERPSRTDMINWKLEQDGRRVTLAEAKRAFDQGSAIFIDVRAPRSYDKQHIPDALNLPSYKWRRAEGILSDIPKDALIITYCTGTSCQSSVSAAYLLAKKYGYQNVKAFYGGWPAWIQAGYPTVGGKKQ